MKAPWALALAAMVAGCTAGDTGTPAGSGATTDTADAGSADAGGVATDAPDSTGPGLDGATNPDVTGAPPPGTCLDLERPPYGKAPYQGVHAGPGNNDLVPCTLTPAFTQRWHALKGLGVAQPNTFSPDGSTLYVTTTQPTPGACTLHALDAATGEVSWCEAVDGAVGGSADVDAGGALYLAATGRVVSFNANGAQRWEHPLGAAAGEAAFGSHFTPGGAVALVTTAGRLLLLDREDGHTLAELDLPAAFGLVAPDGAQPAFGLEGLLPEAVRADMERVYGSGSGLLGVLGGSGAGYTDNTVGVAPNGTLYAIGWGVADGQGAVVQVRVSGDETAPTLTPGWRMDTVRGSASSPSISPDGRWLKVTDGNASAALLDPSAFPGAARIADIVACDANTDAAPDPLVCAPALTVPLASGPALGASPVLDDAEHYLWDVQFGTLTGGATAPDVARYAGDAAVWQTSLPGDAAWTSVLTVTADAIVGTMSRATASDTSLLGVPLPATVSSDLVVLDRQTGHVRFTAPLTDDSTSTVTVGPDGALYVNLLGLLTGLALDTPITGGIVRFDPSENGEPPTPPVDVAAPAQPIPMTGEAPPGSGGPWTSIPFEGTDPPQHPFMAANGRSNIHNDGWMTDTYAGPGPLGKAPMTTSSQLGGLCGTMAFDHLGRVETVCLGIGTPTLWLLDPVTLGAITSYALPPRPPGEPGQNPFQDFTGGGYFYLDNEDRAVIATGERTLVWIAQVPGPEGTRFEQVKSVDLASALPEDERLTGALPDWSGRPWFVSKKVGVVGVVEDDGAIRTLTLGEAVQNSFAVDEGGGVYVVSTAALYRLDAPPGGAPQVTWREVYANTGDVKSGQADAGSGTTPTLLEGGLVAITDNADPIQVVVYRRDAQVIGDRMVCEIPVFEAGESATENSLVAAGPSLFVENNSGYDGIADVSTGTTRPGFARVDVRADGSGCDLVWSVSTVAAPSVVPKLSRQTGLFYTYTKAADSAGWYWTGLDARTGAVAWQVLAGTGGSFNNNYAGLALGPDGAAYLGVLVGVVRLADGP